MTKGLNDEVLEAIDTALMSLRVRLSLDDLWGLNCLLFAGAKCAMSSER